MHWRSAQSMCVNTPNAYEECFAHVRECLEVLAGPPHAPSASEECTVYVGSWGEVVKSRTNPLERPAGHPMPSVLLRGAPSTWVNWVHVTLEALGFWRSQLGSPLPQCVI
eukprot:scaffold125704_cov28-Tisochrysis_lutea.AAC.1